MGPIFDQNFIAPVRAGCTVGKYDERISSRCIRVDDPQSQRLAVARKRHGRFWQGADRSRCRRGLVQCWRTAGGNEQPGHKARTSGLVAGQNTTTCKPDFQSRNFHARELSSAAPNRWCLSIGQPTTCPARLDCRSGASTEKHKVRIWTPPIAVQQGERLLSS